MSNRPSSARQDTTGVEIVRENGVLKDILLRRNGRPLAMLGPAGPDRELSFLPDATVIAPQEPDASQPKQQRLPLLIGSGSGIALERLVSVLEAAYGKQFLLAILDKEDDILSAAGLIERFSGYPGIHWIHEDDPDAALKRVSRLQYEAGGLSLLSITNPFYLRLDRDYYAAVGKICEKKNAGDFWSMARYAKFTGSKPRILLLTSSYFLIGEFVSACARLDYPHHLLQVPEGEMGSNAFVEELLSAVVSFKPDFIFTINHLGVDREGLLASILEKLRLPLASWFVDNPHLILYLYSSLVSAWTSIFTWDADNLESLRALGFEHVSYLPLATDATRFVPLQPGHRPIPELPAAWNGNVAFVGNSMELKVARRLDKTQLSPLLQKSYQKVATGFAASEERSINAYIRQEHPDLLPDFEALPDAEQRLNYETLLTWEATRQYRRECLGGVLPYAPLIVGDSGWKQQLADVPVWHYRSELNYYGELPTFYPCAAVNFNCTSKQMKGAVNQRVFDVPATGSFLLTDYREQVEHLFEPGKEIVCFHSPEEAEALAGDYLAHPELRVPIVRAARKRILQEHCYEHRVQTLVARMREIYG